MLIIAREMGISKKEFLEDYYFDEFILIMKRQTLINKRREEQIKEGKKEKDEVVYWDQIWKK